VQTRPAQAPARLDDRLFTMVAADSGMAEVAAAQMAAERAESDEVKQLAQQLIKDHTQTNQQLMAIAQTVQAPISRRLSPAKQAELAILSSKTGAEFDKAFVDQQLATHLCAVALFQAEAQQGQNAELKQLASETLPKLQEHLQMVRRLPSSNSEK
jgi:putative membrane protein